MCVAIGPMQRSDTVITILCIHSCVLCSSNSNRHLDVRVFLCQLRGFPILSTVVVLLGVLLEALLESVLAMGQLLLRRLMKQSVMVLHHE